MARKLSDSPQSLSLPMEFMFLSVSRVKFVSLTVNLETAFHRPDRLVIHALTASHSSAAGLLGMQMIRGLKATIPQL